MKLSNPQRILRDLKAENFIEVILLLQGMENFNSKPRMGYTVTKQNGNAVIRNRIKRRLKSATQDVFDNIEDKRWDYVMIGKKNALIISFDKLKSEIEFAINKIHKS